MSDNGNYFTFPLAVLHAGKSPLRCIDLAINCGMLSAGKGFRHLNDNEDFEEKIEKICEEQNIGKTARPGSHTEAAEILVGSSICNVTLGRHSRPHLESLTNLVARVPKDGAFVRMKSDFIWPALEQARAEEQPASPWPGKGISWREWRILAAILSVRRNRADFAFIGWETIQARACGFTTKKGLRDAESIPDHLSPSLSRRQIRDTTDQLENLGFYARFRFSTGGRGGLMAYSFRHQRGELAKAVCDLKNFGDRAKIKANRAEDVRKCLEMLERAKSRPRSGQQGDQGSGQG